MQIYTILWDRNDYGRIEIQAENEQAARDKFEQGNYKNVDLNIKGGEINIVSVEKY